MRALTELTPSAVWWILALGLSQLALFYGLVVITRDEP